MLVLFQVNLYIWASNNYIFIINTMKRRDFLTNTALLGAGIPLGMSSAVMTSCTQQQSAGTAAKSYSPEELGMFSFVEVAPDGKPLKAALVGCGDRGTGAATQFLKSGPNVSIIALADLFPDRMATCRKVLSEQFKNEVPDANCFLGFDAYQKVLAMNDIDVVLLCTPTHFRPEQFKAAVEAGKHIFMEKPCAVDPTGIREQLTAAQAEFTAAQSGLTNAQAAITQAQSRIASAQSQYTHGSATAPFSGKFIASSTFAAGQKVSAGQTIGRMINDSQMQLAVQFSSEYAKDIKAGQTATISTSVGQVSAVVSSIDSASGKGTFLVVLTVQNPSGALAQGTSATATINSDSAGTIFSSGSGTLDYIKEQVITAPIGGEITAYNGSNHTYSSGAVIMSISNVAAPDTSDARSSLTAAQSTAAAAQAKVSEIQTRILKLQQEILDATMTASIDGVVTSLNAEEGEETDGTEPLVVVSDLSDTVVTAELMTCSLSSLVRR